MKKLIWLSVCVLLLSGCLTYENKIYTYVINKDGSVDLTVKYVDLKSANISDSLPPDLSTDYNEMMDKYLNGPDLGNDYPNGEIISKRLFEEKGKLCGELKVKFKTCEDAHIYYNKKKKFVVLSFPNTNPLAGETITKTNGVYSEKNSAIVVWESDENKLMIESNLATGSQGESLLGIWKENNK